MLYVCGLIIFVSIDILYLPSIIILWRVFPNNYLIFSKASIFLLFFLAIYRNLA